MGQGPLTTSQRNIYRGKHITTLVAQEPFPPLEGKLPRSIRGGKRESCDFRGHAPFRSKRGQLCAVLFHRPRHIARPLPPRRNWACAINTRGSVHWGGYDSHTPGEEEGVTGAGAEGRPQGSVREGGLGVRGEGEEGFKNHTLWAKTSETMFLQKLKYRLIVRFRDFGGFPHAFLIHCYKSSFGCVCV